MLDMDWFVENFYFEFCIEDTLFAKDNDMMENNCILY